MEALMIGAGGLTLRGGATHPLYRRGAPFETIVGGGHKNRSRRRTATSCVAGYDTQLRKATT